MWPEWTSLPILAAADALENRAVRYYSDAAEKIRALPEVSRGLENPGQKTNQADSGSCKTFQDRKLKIRIFFIMSRSLSCRLSRNETGIQSKGGEHIVKGG